MAPAVSHDGQQDDCAVGRLFPIGLDMQMRQPGSDARQEEQACEGAP